MKILVKAKKIQLTASGSVDVDVDKEEEEEMEEEETLEERRKSLAKLSLRQVFQHSIDAEDLPRWFGRSISKAFLFLSIRVPKRKPSVQQQKDARRGPAEVRRSEDGAMSRRSTQMSRGSTQEEILQKKAEEERTKKAASTQSRQLSDLVNYLGEFQL